MTDLDDTATALRSAAARLARRLRTEAGQAAYTDPQVAVLRRLLTDGPATASELARAEGVKPQSMAATVGPLERAGDVVRRPHPDDGRAVQLFLSPDTERTLRHQRAVKEGWLVRAMSERLSSDEQHILREATALIERLLDD